MKTFKIAVLIFLVLTTIIFYAGYKFYNVFFESNITLVKKEYVYIYIPTGSNFDDVVGILKNNAGLVSEESFRYTAQQKGYIDLVKSGRYKIENNWSNNNLVNVLRAGKQTPVMVTFNNIRFKKDLADRVSGQLEFTDDELLNLLNSNEVASKYGFNTENFPVMFLPNTYEFYWNISAEQFVNRMNTEYKRFWNESRQSKARNIGLSEIEVSILSSIVEDETTKRDEMSSIAGVYINRLNRRILLQADPTVKFAVGYFSIQRVLFSHLEIDSPYNTYKYSGLPPGPICLPELSTIDAVLNYEEHDYLFFCAKDDFSGYHVFAKTLAQHSANARKFQQEMNRRGIRK